MRAKYDPLLNAIRTSDSSGQYNILDYGAVADDTTDCVAALKAALAAAAAAGGGTVHAPTGDYWFDINGDSDSILIPSNCAIVGDPGTVFRWDYWGSPFLCAVEVQNVVIRNIEIEWGGTFGATAGSRAFSTYSRSVPAYQWCANIVSVGSDDVTIEHVRMYGTTTASNQNIGIYYAGPQDGVSTNTGLILDKLWLDDLCVGLMVEGASDFSITNLYCARYSQASDALYGPGHVVYAIYTVEMTNGVLRGVFDKSVTNDTDVVGGHTLSIKNMRDCIVSDIFSTRPSGILNWTMCNHVQFNNLYCITDTTVSDTSVGLVYFSSGVGPSSYITFNNVDIHFTANVSVDRGAFGLGTPDSVVPYFSISNLTLRLYTTGVEVPAVSIAGTDGTIDGTIIFDGTGTDRVLVNFRPNSDRIVAFIKSAGSNPSTRFSSEVGAGSNIKYSARVSDSDVWVEQAEVNGLGSALALKAPIASPAFTTQASIIGAAPALYYGQTDASLDLKWKYDGTFLKLWTCASSTDGTGAEADNIVQIDQSGSMTFGKLTGGTYNGNYYASASDRYPGVIFRSGTSGMSQFISDVSVGDILCDVSSGRNIYIRDGVAGTTFLTLNATTSTLTGKLSVTNSTVATSASAAAVAVTGGIGVAGGVFSARTISGASSVLANSFNATVQNTAGNNRDISVVATSIPSAASTANIYSLECRADLHGNAAYLSSGQLIGLQNEIRINTGTATGTYSGWCRAVNSAINNQNANVTVTNSAALYCQAPTATGALTNYYGLYMEAISGPGTFYSIYTAGAGAVRIGDTTASSSAASGSIITLGGVGVAKEITAGLSIKSVGATAGIGYATGAGGAVTQGTSRTTGVTLNKICGAITLVSAAGSTTPASFTVTNSAVAATDTVILSQKSGTDKYVLLVTAVGAGSFEITAYTTGGTTTEQPVINFSVIKAVAA